MIPLQLDCSPPLLQEFEREKHAHSILQFQFAEVKEALKQREEMLEVSSFSFFSFPSFLFFFFNLGAFCWFTTEVNQFSWTVFLTSGEFSMPV